MSPIRLTARRTIGFAGNTRSTAFIVGAFLAATAARFVYSLSVAEGGRLGVSVIWATAVAPLLPVLAAFLGMDSWSEERRSGRLDVMMSSPVPDCDFTFGKFAGVWIVSLCTLALSLVSTALTVAFFAPLCRISVAEFSLAFAAMAMQSMLWCAVSVLTSAIFMRASIAFCATLVVLVGIPRGTWALMLAWSDLGRDSVGEMLLDAQIVDLASGVISGSAVIPYCILTAFALFAAVVAVSMRRLVGVGARRLRTCAVSSLLLSAIAAVLAVVLSVRLDFTIDIALGSNVNLSERTRGILADTRGEISAVCFMSRKDMNFRSISHTLRAFSSEADASGGATLSLYFVDPVWDYSEAARLVRSGVKPGSVVFYCGRRREVIELSEGISERAFASVILRLTAPPRRRNIRWTSGHGEVSFDDYSSFGMSDIARELSRDGYSNLHLDLSANATIPAGCALIVIAGAKDGFSSVECARLESYLKQGGRLLVLSNGGEAGGIPPLLAAWGISSVMRNAPGRTFSGRETIVTDFADHPVTGPLKGSSIVLNHAAAFTPSAAVSAASAVERIAFTALAKSGDDVLAAMVERGMGGADDLGIRPARIIVVGDTSFVMNGQLASQATANREFFLNAVACLSGTDAMTPGGVESGVLVSGMDRTGRRRMMFCSVLAVPLFTLAVLLMIAWHRRSRR